MTMNKQRENPKFQFLFGGEWHAYYKWRVATETQQNQGAFGWYLGTWGVRTNGMSWLVYRWFPASTSCSRRRRSVANPAAYPTAHVCGGLPANPSQHASSVPPCPTLQRGPPSPRISPRVPSEHTPSSPPSSVNPGPSLVLPESTTAAVPHGKQPYLATAAPSSAPYQPSPAHWPNPPASAGLSGATEGNRDVRGD